MTDRAAPVALRAPEEHAEASPNVTFPGAVGPGPTGPGPGPTPTGLDLTGLDLTGPGPTGPGPTIADGPAEAPSSDLPTPAATTDTAPSEIGSAPEATPVRASWHRRVVAALAIVVLAAIGSALGGAYWLHVTPDRPGPLTEARDLVVLPGSTMDVAYLLAEAGVIVDPFQFRLFAWLSRDAGKLRAAEFTFPAQVSPRQVLAILRTARPVEHRLTIQEGLTARQIAALFNAAEAAAGTVDAIEEGSVLPETYTYERGTARAALVLRARRAMERELAAAWADRAPELKLGSPRELLILASIVERETAKADERALVAGVYLNRLQIGMRLQADPTVVYAASGGSGVLNRKLSRADLERGDLYNTYRYGGLPPGPICSPGAASLRAAARPAQTDALYFVADGLGGHAFSRTREEHERHVARWRALTAAGGVVGD